MTNVTAWPWLSVLRLFRPLALLLNFWILTLAFVGSDEPVYACDLKESSSSEAAVFRRHLVGPCTLDERKAFAIPTHLLFQALQEGKSLDLRGVVIVGDLMFDQLSQQPLNATSLPSDVAQQIIATRHTQQGRIVQGSISIRDAVIEGSWATNLRNGVLIMLGDISLTETTFQQSVDFSQTVFLKTVDFSNSAILYEGFFIRAQFEKQANFDGVTFGTHSRFHKARFQQNVSFFNSRFNGLAEFLEVVFAKNASFEKVQFHMGTGFSGSQFHGSSNFSEALFVREAFFRFTNFQQEAKFQEAKFQEVCDFTSTKFLGDTNFSDTEFLVSPNFSETILEDEWKMQAEKDFRRVNLALSLAFLGFLCFLIWGICKWRQSFL